MDNKTIAFAILFVVGSTTAQLEFPGKCADLSVVDPFDPISYLGRWYEIEGYNQTASLNGDCITANYGLDGGSIVVYNTLVDHSTGEFRSANGTATLTHPTAGKLAVNFPQGGVNTPYWVLDTDYVSYAIVWSCRNSESTNSNLQTVYFLSRTRNPTFERRQAVRDYLTRVGLPTQYLKETVQVDCPRA